MRTWLQLAGWMLLGAAVAAAGLWLLPDRLPKAPGGNVGPGAEATTSPAPRAGEDVPADGNAPASTGRAARRTAMPEQDAAPILSLADAVAADPAELESLRRENEQLRVQLEDLLNWILVSFQGRYPLPDRLLSRLRLPATDPQYTLSKDVLEFLNITPEEASRINDALYYARVVMQLMEDQLMQIESPSPDMALVYIPPFEEHGTAIRDRLYQAVDGALGADRFARLLEVSGDDLRERYHDFGRAERVIRFRLDPPVEPGAAPMLNIRDEWSTPAAGGERTIRAREIVAADIPEDYRPYLDRLNDTKGTAP